MKTYDLSYGERVIAIDVYFKLEELPALPGQMFENWVDSKKVAGRTVDANRINLLVLDWFDTSCTIDDVVRCLALHVGRIVHLW